MPYNILTIPEFDKNIKKLSKRYKLIKNDLFSLIELLRKNPHEGIRLFGSCYKIRLGNSSVPTGKSKGFRVITYCIDEENNLYLLSIYSKSDQENLKEEDIIELLKNIQR
jgi:mRNA-degrading endonuclease RelE of RelBE toxin-antitoxin system